MRKGILISIATLAFIVAGQVEAAVVVFDNEVDYNAAVGPQIFLINFDGSPPGGASVSGASFSPAVAFGSPEASDPTLVLWNSDAISDNGSTIALNGVGPLDGVFTDPVYAFALVFSSASQAETVSLYDEAHNLIDMVTAPNASGFFGVLSDTSIKSLFVDNGNFPNTGDPDRFFIDDFRANEPPIQVVKELTRIEYGQTIIGDDEDVPELPEVPIHTRIEFTMVISVTNNSPSTIAGVVVKDRLGGDLEFVSSVPAPTTIETKGNSDKVFLSWAIGDLVAGQTAEITLVVATDVNPGQGKKAEPINEYTEAGVHELNSGANAKGMIGEIVVSHSSGPISVLAVGVPDLIVLELQVLGHTADSITYSYVIRNIGTGPANLDGPTAADADNVSVQAYLSDDTIFNNAGDAPAGGTILGPSPLGLLNPGQTFSGSFSSGTLGANPADYAYLTLMVDWGEVVAESDETNNTAATLIP